jgi:cyclase
MLPRVIPTIVIDEGRAIHTEGFQYSSYLGDPLNIARLFGELEADEILLLDRTQGFHKTLLGNGLLRRLTEQVFTPLSYGGAISQMHQVDEALDSGLDKIVLKLGSPGALELVEWTASKFGSQAVMACINYVEHGFPSVDGVTFQTENLPNLIKTAVDVGAGEILLQNASRSGSKSGLGAASLQLKLGDVTPPVILSGGVGSMSDIKEAFELGFSGVGASTFFCIESRSETPLTSYLTPKDREFLG